MKKILGIIAEYNPFHNGHKYHIEKAREISKADYVIALISSNFVQRGEASILNSYERAKMCLLNGVDAVYEMPSYFSSSSAESFAFYGIDFFNKLNIDFISFGTELANTNKLEEIANLLIREDEIFKNKLHKHLKNGLNFPLAREKSIKECLNLNSENEILFSPNNILAIEYFKALKILNSKIETIIIKRTSNNYNLDKLSEDGFSSATSIRKLLYENKYTDVKNAVPKNIYSYLDTLNPLYYDDFFSILNFQIQNLKFQNFDFSEILDIDTNLANKINNSNLNFNNIHELINFLKTKNYTYTRISRVLIHILLGIRTNKFSLFKENKTNFARLLGFNKKKIEILKLLKERGNINFINKLKDVENLSTIEKELFKHNLFCEKIYSSIYLQKYKKELKNQIVIV